MTVISAYPEDNDPLSYDRLDGEWRQWYETAHRFEHKVPAQDRGDIRHNIILELALARARDGDTTELIETVADDRAIDLEAWSDARTFLLACPHRLVQIANKRLKGIPLEPKDKMYLQRFRQREQKRLFGVCVFRLS